MKLSHFFIDHPRFAAVVSIFIMVFGLAAAAFLPVAQYPNIVPPTVQITASYPGASADVVARTVAVAGSPVSMDISPKHSPAPSVATLRGSFPSPGPRTDLPCGLYVGEGILDQAGKRVFSDGGETVPEAFPQEAEILFPFAKLHFQQAARASGL